MNFKSELKKRTEEAESVIRKYLPEEIGFAKTMAEAMNYSMTAGGKRLRPILITTLTTVISMIPMSLGIGTGTEMMQGMGIIIIGGLIASTLLILILLPVFYRMVYGKEMREKHKRVGKRRKPKSGAAEDGNGKRTDTEGQSSL